MKDISLRVIDKGITAMIFASPSPCTDEEFKAELRMALEERRATKASLDIEPFRCNSYSPEFTINPEKQGYR